MEMLVIVKDSETKILCPDVINLEPNIILIQNTIKIEG